MPAILYKHIVDGRDQPMTAGQYNANHLGSAEEFERDFLDSFPEKVETYKKEILRNRTVLYTIKYKEYAKKVCILWGPMKTSGINGTHDKRLQIHSATPLREETPYFIIASYYTGDKTIYAAALTGTRDSIRLANNGNTYSSFWFNYSELWETYRSELHEWIYAGNKRIIATTANRISNIHDEITSMLRGDATPTPENPSDSDTGIPPFVNIEGIIDSIHDDHSLPRNPEYKEIALKRENYTCELCGTTRTFIDGNNEEYFEGHHLIMYNLRVQKRFDYCLDHPNNIICLCPTCHRHIHLGNRDEIKEMIVKLFKKHNNLLKEYSIRTLAPIIEDYITR